MKQGAGRGGLEIKKASGTERVLQLLSKLLLLPGLCAALLEFTLKHLYMDRYEEIGTGIISLHDLLVSSGFPFGLASIIFACGVIKKRCARNPGEIKIPLVIFIVACLVTIYSLYLLLHGEIFRVEHANYPFFRHP